MLGLGNLLSRGKVLGFPNQYSFNFDGSNDYLKCDIGSTTYATYTISCWINADSLTNYTRLIRVDDSNYRYLGLHGDGKVISGYNSGGWSELMTSTTLSTGTWYHLALVDDDSETKIYINGSATTLANSIQIDGSNVYISSHGGAGNYFDGKIDEVGFWNTALSASDIAKIASKPLNLSLASAYATDRTSNLKLWLRAGDKGQPEKNPSITRSDYYTDFDGTDDVVELGSDASIDNVFVGGATLTAWINPSSDGETNYGRIFDKSDATSGADGWHFLVTDESSSKVELRFGHGFTNQPNWDSSLDVPLNEWTHVAVTYNNSSTSNNPSFYINGISATVTEGTAPSGTVVDDSSQDLFIGNNTGGDRTFAGGISSASIYKTIIDAQTIKQFAKSRFTPMRDNRFSVVDFDGSNDYIDCGTGLGTSLGDSYSGDLSVSFWVKPDTITSNDGVFAISNRLNALDDSIEGTDDPLQIWIESSNLNAYVGATSVTSIPINTWTHFALCFDSTANMQYLYKNGVLADSDANTTTPDFDGIPTLIGAYWDAGYLDGSISSVSIYNTAKSADEVYAIYQQGITYDESSLSGLVGYWRMGSGAGDAYPTIKDQSTNSNDGTITNGASSDIVQQMVAGYDMGAFENSTEELGGELITDGGFDDASNWNAGGSWSVSGSKATNGASGADIIQPQNDNYLVNGKLYKFTASITLVSGSGNFKFYAEDNYSTITATSGTNTYTAYLISSGTTPRIRESSGSLIMDVDDFSVKEVLQSEVSDTYPAIIDVNEPVLGAELFTDGDMEASGTTGWDDHVNTHDATLSKETSIVNNGSKSLKALRESGAGGVAQAVAGLSTSKLYKLTGYVYSSSGNVAIAYKNDSQLGASATFLETISTTGEWVSFTHHFVPPATTTYIGIWKSNDDTYALLDDWSLKEVQGNPGVMTNQASDDLVYSSVLPDQSYLVGNSSPYNFIDLDGSDEYIALSDSIGFTGAFSVSMWIYPDALSNETLLGTKASGNERMILESATVIDLRFADGTVTDITHGLTFTTGAWQHFAFVRNSSNVCTVYRNGSAGGTTGTLSGTFSPDAVGIANSANYINGKIGQVAIWNKALSASEVSAIYSLGRHANLLDKYSDNLVGYWAFSSLDASTGLKDVGNGTIYDRSGQSNHGTATNTEAADLASSPNATPHGYSSGDTIRDSSSKA